MWLIHFAYILKNACKNEGGTKCSQNIQETKQTNHIFVKDQGKEDPVLENPQFKHTPFCLFLNIVHHLFIRLMCHQVTLHCSVLKTTWKEMSCRKCAKSHTIKLHISPSNLLCFWPIAFFLLQSSTVLIAVILNHSYFLSKQNLPSNQGHYLPSQKNIEFNYQL